MILSWYIDSDVTAGILWVLGSTWYQHACCVHAQTCSFLIRLPKTPWDLRVFLNGKHDWRSSILSTIYVITDIYTLIGTHGWIRDLLEILTLLERIFKHPYSSPVCLPRFNLWTIRKKKSWWLLIYFWAVPSKFPLSELKNKVYLFLCYCHLGSKNAIDNCCVALSPLPPRLGLMDMLCSWKELHHTHLNSTHQHRDVHRFCFFFVSKYSSFPALLAKCYLKYWLRQKKNKFLLLKGWPRHCQVERTY